MACPPHKVAKSNIGQRKHEEVPHDFVRLFRVRSREKMPITRRKESDEYGERNVQRISIASIASPHDLTRHVIRPRVRS